MGASLEVHFIGSLIEKTISHKLKWHYLLWSINDDKAKETLDFPRLGNPELESLLNMQEMYDNDKRELFFDRTFWTKTKSGYIYYISSAFNGHPAPPAIYVQRDKNSMINKLSLPIEDSDLYHLENIIVYSMENSNFEEAQKFMDDFLAEE